MPKFKPEYNGFERNVSARHFALHRLQCIPACWITPQIRRHLLVCLTERNLLVIAPVEGAFRSLLIQISTWTMRRAA